MIYFPYADIYENANTLVKHDLLKQIQKLQLYLALQEPPPLEWRNDGATAIPYMIMLYITTVEVKYGQPNNRRLFHATAKVAPAEFKLPDWVNDARVTESWQGYLRFLGLCRVWYYTFKKMPDAKLFEDLEEFEKRVSRIKLTKGIRPDYSQFDVPLYRTPLRLKSNVEVTSSVD